MCKCFSLRAPEPHPSLYVALFAIFSSLPRLLLHSICSQLSLLGARAWENGSAGGQGGAEVDTETGGEAVFGVGDRGGGEDVLCCVWRWQCWGGFG